jgi:hypothetical protein
MMMMVMLFPFFAVPITAAVPIPVALPARNDDDRRRHYNNGPRNTDIDSDTDINRMRGTRQGNPNAGKH